jgi:predicted DNA-binding transcriptional regulator AlpA
MDANQTQNITNEILMEQIMELKSMVAQMQLKIESIENPVDDFLTKWIDTFEVMRMLNISRRTIDNYIKAGKLKPVRINKRNHFAVAEVKGLMYVPDSPKIRTLREEVQIMMGHLAKMEEAGEEW